MKVQCYYNKTSFRTAVSSMNTANLHATAPIPHMILIWFQQRYFKFARYLNKPWHIQRSTYLGKCLIVTSILLLEYANNEQVLCQMSFVVSCQFLHYILMYSWENHDNFLVVGLHNYFRTLNDLFCKVLQQNFTPVDFVISILMDVRNLASTL